MCRNLGDFHDLYLCTDVQLLADVFESFPKVCLKYGLGPTHNYTSLGLFWDANKVKKDFELLKVYDQHMSIGKGMQDGISIVSKLFATANNLRVVEYDPSKLHTHNVYLDANNLYGWAMSQAVQVVLSGALTAVSSRKS